MTEKIITKFYKERNIKNTTIKGYEGAFKHYLQSQNSNSIKELLEEAVIEQKNRVPPPETKLKQRLLNFRQYLIDKDFATYTITTYFSKIVSFYLHMDIMIPPMKQAKLEKPYVSSYDDLPTKEELRNAFNMADMSMKAFMTFQLSSGQARAEACSITVEQFLKSCEEYCDEQLPVRDQVKQLSLRDDVIPVFYLKRLKTDVYYYTCCSPEAVYYICKELLSRVELRGEDSLFDMSYSSVCEKYQFLNDSLELGRVGYYRKLRSHVVRKWHATMLPLSPEEIDLLQGRTRSSIHETYIKLNPHRVKQMYMEVVEYVMLWPEKWMKNTSPSTKFEEKVETVSENGAMHRESNSCQISYLPSVDVQVYKDIGRLEARIGLLEDRIKQLEGK
jgi:hypothetical protein